MPMRRSGHMTGEAVPLKKWHRQSVPMLTYFQAASLAHYIRVLFAIGDVEYVDRRITKEEWAAKYKAYSPTGQCPLLEVGEDMITQSGAIALYAASKANLTLECPLQMAKALSMQTILIDWRGSAAAEGARYPDEEERKAKMMAWWKESTPKTLDEIKVVLSSIPPTQGSPFVFGRLTLADVILYDMMHRIEEWLGADFYAEMLKQVPRITEAALAVKALPAVRKVEASYSTPKLTLHYYATEGRATLMRWVIGYGGLNVQERNFTKDEWETVRNESPTKRCPWLTIECDKGHVETIVETSAIMAYLGAKAKMIPTNPIEATHMYAVDQTVGEIMGLMSYAMHHPTMAPSELLPKMLAGPFPDGLTRLNAIVKQRQDHTDFVVGGKFSLADVYVGTLVHFFNIRYGGCVIPDLWTAYPNLIRVYKRVMTIPQISAQMWFNKAKPTIYYFDITGRGSAIRFMLEHGNVEHVWQTYTGQEWAESYKQVPLNGQCPYMEIEGKLMHETLAIVKYAAERADLVPLTTPGRCTADSLYSVWNNVLGVMYSWKGWPRGDDFEAHRSSKYEDFCRAVDLVEKMLAVDQSCEGYAVENHLTWIDFYLAGELNWTKDSTWNREDIAQKWPHLYKTYTLVYALPCAAAVQSKSSAH